MRPLLVIWSPPFVFKQKQSRFFIFSVDRIAFTEAPHREAGGQSVLQHPTYKNHTNCILYVHSLTHTPPPTTSIPIACSCHMTTPRPPSPSLPSTDARTIMSHANCSRRSQTSLDAHFFAPLRAHPAPLVNPHPPTPTPQEMSASSRLPSPLYRLAFKYQW